MGTAAIILTAIWVLLLSLNALGMAVPALVTGIVGLLAAVLLIAAALSGKVTVP